MGRPPSVLDSVLVVLGRKLVPTEKLQADEEAGKRAAKGNKTVRRRVK